ncbi:MAG: UDP-N-acetylmuramoyl-L-alanyl-D-glutamate--2,6-diaminopimelate ligase, partial [Candidatus Hydrogenedentes bacterium]|nr:UDP-N-acetylmuramoyl-L-alanyl-D-glutamate--2,6-diaminopimelate ligase [Candidatus Hydrogenedentota bacterium]
MIMKDDIARVLALNKEVPEVEISSVTEDSRRVKPGALFVAVAGEKMDGHAYIDLAVQAGAVAILGNNEAQGSSIAVPYIYHKNPRQAVALLAHELAGSPSEKMCVIGITGTNGKTSTAFLVQHILEQSGHPCAKFGTLGYDLGDVCVEAAHTTPFGEDLASLFARAEQSNLSHVVMEVSSHALAQDRVAGIAFNVAAFTNLTRDHLDYHETMDAYLQAKLTLFERVREEFMRQESEWPCFSVVNYEDLLATRFTSVLPESCYTFGEGGLVSAEEIRLHLNGTEFIVVSPWGTANAHLQLVGRHNVLNALCAITVCGGLGVPLDTIISALATFTCVPGRFEAVFIGQEFQVIVDYAHT